MMRRLFLVTLFAITLAVSVSGCCVDACGTRRGALGRRMGPQVGGDCADGMCGRRVFHPLQTIRNRATCGAGCGEMYVDEWLSDPPDCCDPCDRCGNFVGRGGGCGGRGCGIGGCGGGCGGCGGGCGGGGCGGLFSGGIWNLWGHRYSPNGSYGGFGYDEMEMGDGEMMYDGQVMEGDSVPTMSPSQSPTPAARQAPSAIKKTIARQPYYDQAPTRPAATTRVMPGYRTANAQPMPNGSRVRR